MPYIDLIKEILQEAREPITAEDISMRLKLKNHLSKITHASITPKQIRNRIRKDNNENIETIKPRPYTYRLKYTTQNLWVLKTVHEDDKASQTIDSYGDSLSEYYNYDNFVANSQQIKNGDQAILIDKEKILGFANIDNIESTQGSKTIRRCPECPSTTIDKRKTKRPTYRCNKGHEFDVPLEETKTVTKYSANFSKYIPIGKFKNDLKQLRPYYLNGYNQNMSMQRLSSDALDLFGNIKENLTRKSLTEYTLRPGESYIEEEQSLYQENNKDEREISIRAIKLRRGQQDFRKKLLLRYNNTCVITGCKIIDILEAAHIRPYRGQNDNHPSNGLLLRADIHTLFDLNLVAIEPETLTILFHPKVILEYKEYHRKKLIVNTKNPPNKEGLKWRWHNSKSFRNGDKKRD